MFPKTAWYVIEKVRANSWQPIPGMPYRPDQVGQALQAFWPKAKEARLEGEHVRLRAYWGYQGMASKVLLDSDHMGTRQPVEGVTLSHGVGGPNPFVVFTRADGYDRPYNLAGTGYANAAIEELFEDCARPRGVSIHGRSLEIHLDLSEGR